jgi:hypothetical protein
MTKSSKNKEEINKEVRKNACMSLGFVRLFKKVRELRKVF